MWRSARTIARLIMTGLEWTSIAIVTHMQPSHRSTLFVVYRLEHGSLLLTHGMGTIASLYENLINIQQPFGLFRYKRALQGFKGYGDGYNWRLNSILSTVERKERVVDDMLHHDAELEQHWWRTIDLLIKLESSGTVLNPKKFQLAQKQVKFSGFPISENTIEPLPKYLNAIRDFPKPQATTDIRSWFGLINQVANYAQLRDHLEIFRPYLSPMEWRARQSVWGIKICNHQRYSKRCRDFWPRKTHMSLSGLVMQGYQLFPSPTTSQM